MFKVGDEVVCVDNGWSEESQVSTPQLVRGEVYVVENIGVDPFWNLPFVNVFGRRPSVGALGFNPERFRKVQRKNSRLTLEAFFTVPGGFEEPKRAPAKKKADA